MRFLPFCLVLCLWGCNPSSIKTDPLAVFEKQLTTQWTSDPALPLDSLGNPDFLYAAGGHLTFVEPRAELLLLDYNLKTGALSRMLPYGKAKNECMNVHQIGSYPSVGVESFYVYDNYQRKIFIYTLQSDIFSLDRIQTVPEGIQTFSFLGPDRILGCAGDSSRYMRADTSGQIDCRFGDYQEFGLSVPVGSGLLQGLSLAVSLSDGAERYAWFSFYGSGYQIIDSTPDSCRIIKQAMYKMPEFQVQSAEGVDYPTFGQNTEIGYSALATDGKYIYALYSGHTLSEVLRNPDLAWRSRRVCVYDWEGNPRLLLNADHDLKTLAYDDVHDRLYALNLKEEGAYALIFLELGDIRRQNGL